MDWKSLLTKSLTQALTIEQQIERDQEFIQQKLGSQNFQEDDADLSS